MCHYTPGCELADPLAFGLQCVLCVFTPALHRAFPDPDKNIHLMLRPGANRYS